MCARKILEHIEGVQIAFFIAHLLAIPELDPTSGKCELRCPTRMVGQRESRVTQTRASTSGSLEAWIAVSLPAAKEALS